MSVFLLTSCIAVKEEGVLELEVQVFGDWLCQVLHIESVHNGETMPGRCQSEIHRGHSPEMSQMTQSQPETRGTSAMSYSRTVVLKNKESTKLKNIQY